MVKNPPASAGDRFAPWPGKLSPGTTATEPALWSLEPQLLTPVLPRRESPWHDQRAPPLSATEEAQAATKT